MTAIAKSVSDCEDSKLAQAASEGVAGRVSLIVPCFNVEQYLEQFLSSVLSQTYKNLEVILINDGATDGTSEMLRRAIPTLQAEGYTTKLVEQANKGLGGAIDTGLRHVTGEFLMWPDPDDWLLPNSIARRVELMRGHPDVGLLRSNCQLFIQAKQEFDGHFMPTNQPARRVPELFEDLVYQRFFFAPVCHFVRCDMFWQVHPDRSIWYSPASSQNFQLLVPFVERFPVLQVSEPLAVYRVREDSRSRANTKTPERLMSRHEQLYELTLHTLPKLCTYTPNRAARLQNQHWRNKMLPTAIRGKMMAKGLDLIVKADLPPWRKAMARACLQLRCNSALDALDARTGRVLSRVIARTLDTTVWMPEDEAIWGTGPLWDAAGARHEKASA